MFVTTCRYNININIQNLQTREQVNAKAVSHFRRQLVNVLVTVDLNPLKGRGVNWLHFAIQV